MADGGGAEKGRRAGGPTGKADREEILGIGEGGAPMYKGRRARLAQTDLKLVDLDDPGDTEGLLVARDEEPDGSDGTARH